MAHYPPTPLEPPPSCAHERAFVLTALINNASAALGAKWVRGASGSLSSYHTMPLRARTPTGVDADDSWGPEDVARLVGTGPWKLAGSVGGKMIRLDGVHFLAHGYLTSSKGHGRWAHSTKGTIEVQVCATRFKLRPQFGVQGWSMASPDDATDVAATTMPGHQAQEATGVRITAVLALSLIHI